MRRTRYAALAVGVLMVVATGGVANAGIPHGSRGEATTRINVSSSGVQADAGSGGFGPVSPPSGFAARGRYVAFASTATNLVPGDTNGVSDAFVHDRWTGRTTRVSLSSNGAQADARTHCPVLSEDGRYVAFNSLASNLVPGDTNEVLDVFVRDLRTGRTSRVSVSSAGAEPNAHAISYCPAAPLSRDGRHIVFTSAATNLVPGDTNGVTDVFLHDLRTERTSRVSVSSAGVESSGATPYGAGISGDGRYVTFAADDGELVAGDTNGVRDIFVHDRRTERTSRITVSSTGTQANGLSNTGSMSRDGRYVSFGSAASNLVPGDTNGGYDVFVHDRWTGRTSRVSVSSAGEQANFGGGLHGLSENGRFVVFCSGSSNLVPGDTNDVSDVFVRDLRAGTTTRVSLSSTGEQANGECDHYSPLLSRDGRYVAYFSEANNLVPGDTNGVGDAFVHDRHARGDDQLVVDQ